MMDSLTRVAMAQREIGLSVGEPPATRGYPPSTFSVLARLLERAGTAETGSVTGIYTVLVDGDDHNEPIADSARSILDGHVVLDRKLAVAGHFPSVDVARLDLPRGLQGQLRRSTPAPPAPCARCSPPARRRRTCSTSGAYQAGHQPAGGRGAWTHEDAINVFLQQRMDDQTPAAQSWDQLNRLTRTLGGM